MKPMEEIIVQNNSCSSKLASLERRVRPQKEQALNCPRCNSTNTKFCYYNNYSLSQPRYFCKTCRRYWTEGGSLRNIPVGGGSRKSKKFSSTPSTNSSISSSSQNLQLPHSHHDLDLSSQSNFQSPNSKICEGQHQGQDLNLGFPSHHDFKTISELIQVPSFNNKNIHSPNSSSHHLSALELLTGTNPNTSRGLNSFMPLPESDPNSIYSSGFSHLQEFKPTLNFSFDGNVNGSGGGRYGMQENVSGRVLFPLEALKQVSNSSYIDQQNRGEQGGDSTGYWNGVLGGGGSW